MREINAVEEFFPLIIGIVTIISMVVFIPQVYNFNTGFWCDTAFCDPDYYVFHPSDTDTCEQLQFKYELFHPNGVNPIKYENLNELIKKNCGMSFMNNGVEG